MVTYEAKFDPTKNKGVFGISLVNDPAMEGLFIALSKETEIKFAEVDKEQRILMGLVLEPNKPIYRNQNGEEFNILFKRETIKELSHNFFKAGHQKDSSLEHDKSIDGVTFVESWIVEDSKIDKSANFGFNYPPGSWLATMKVDSDEIWNEYVKTGKVQGFSIDAMIDLEEQVNLKTEVNMSSEIKTGFDKLTETLLVALGLQKKEEEGAATDVVVELGSVKSGDVDIFFDGEMFEVGGAVWVLGEDDAKVALPVGEYPIEGDRTLVVSEEGLVGEITQQEAAAEEEVKAEAETGASDTAQAEAITNAIKSVLVKYKADQDAKFEALEVKFTTLEKEKVELQEEVVELGKQPAAKKVKSSAADRPLTNFEKMKANRELV